MSPAVLLNTTKQKLGNRRAHGRIAEAIPAAVVGGGGQALQVVSATCRAVLIVRIFVLIIS
jgi:hypothetical protein